MSHKAASATGSATASGTGTSEVTSLECHGTSSCQLPGFRSDLPLPSSDFAGEFGLPLNLPVGSPASQIRVRVIKLRLTRPGPGPFKLKQATWPGPGGPVAAAGRRPQRASGSPGQPPRRRGGGEGSQCKRRHASAAPAGASARAGRVAAGSPMGIIKF